MAKTKTNTNTNTNTGSESKAKTNSKNTSQMSSSSQTQTTQSSLSSTTGGSSTRTYTDTSGFSDETKARQNWLNENTTFKPSDNLIAAQGKKSVAESALDNYGPYTSKYGDAISRTLDDILNRKQFSYDFNEDALYQNYKDQYTLMGKQAAANAAAANAALTGGYGSSYGTSAAAQANQQYMTQLNDVIPELYQLALERYDKESSDLYNRYNILNSEDDKEYGRYRDTRNDMVSDRDYYNSDYYNLRNAEESAFQDEWNRNYSMFNTMADFEKQTVTEGNEWSTSSESSMSNTNSNEYQEAIEKARQTTSEKSKSYSSESSASVSESSGSGKGSGNSSKKKKNNRTGTNTPQKNVDEAAKEVERILKLPNTSYVPSEYLESGSHAYYAYAVDKLTEYLNSGKINKTDYERIANQAGLDKYR